MIIHERGIGKTLGYPTANLDCSKKEVKLPTGVYAAWATLKRKRYMGGLVVTDNPWKVEVHLLNYGGADVYGEFLSVDPVQKVSEIEPYKSKAALIKKIQRDLKMVREVLT